MSIATQDHFIDVFRSLFKEEQEVIIGSTRFRELEEWSSMQALIVIAAIDEHFGVTIPEQDFRGANTIEDLYDLTRIRSVHA